MSCERLMRRSTVILVLLSEGATDHSFMVSGRVLGGVHEDLSDS